ncbi:phage late control D family protein [Aurantimonas sp. VKM B-3413]|uniref:phage late control D family protein n=1 Tax=Aurantimonas sp. VKM B-3413 TaxID=2779401 RepID=UPI001E4BD9C6|nr:late control D family protein [Aurantimonas sp. VKM B-3413]MCB8835920.1 late control D family protein [Aurantimonas sp. VKM B-3413]
MAWKVYWQVFVGGANATIGMRPYLQEIEVVDRAGIESDRCRLVFDDSKGQLFLPKPKTLIKVLLNGVVIFDGVVDSTPWRLTRGGGRVLEVNAKAFDTRGKAIEPQFWHLDDKPLSEALKKAGKLAGIDVTVDPELGQIVRDYWSPAGMHFIEWGERLRAELGATFKIKGGTEAVLAKRGSGKSVTGAALPVVRGVCGQGGNVISVNIDPSKGRPRAKTKRVRWFDRKAAKFVEKDVTIEMPDVGEAIDTQRWLAADKDHAKDMADGHKSDAERDAGVGQVEIDLDPTAMAEGGFTLSGARPGIDGLYRISGATQRANRGGGAVTQLDLAQPQEGAGKDTRKPTTSALKPPANVPVPTPAPR